MVIAVTGHRPNKMPQGYGYDITNEKWIKLKELFKKLLTENNCTEAITGMALGVDTVFALAVLELKESGYDIKLHCAIPCNNHSSMWPESSKNLYNQILEKADIIKIVSNREYKPFLMQIRNEYMVDLCDKLIAVWDGNYKSGTANCVRYANSQNKKTIIVNP